MPIIRQKDDTCYFVHIPRTGGRYISSLADHTKDTTCLYWKPSISHRYHGIELMHLHYPIYEKRFNLKNIPTIAIVRNPLDKIYSSLQNMHNESGIDYDIQLRDEFECYKLIYDQILNDSSHNNWFMPQYKFLSPTTAIWKYEWGFDKKFQEWFYQKTHILLDITPRDYFKVPSEKRGNILKLSSKSKENIKKVYYQDYKQLGYDTI